MLEVTLAAIWLLGAGWRLLQQARYYQIEEYMSGRYLRWLASRRGRLLPARASGAWLLGLAFAGLLAEAPDSIAPQVILAVAGVIAVFPAQTGEVKKSFVLTARVKRLLAGGWLVGALAFALVIGAFLPLEGALIRAFQLSALGFGLFLLAPLCLVAGNLIMTPLEGALRRRYLSQARATLGKINPKIVGVTGSYGKTTTKNFLREILNVRYRAYATPKSYNTLMGIALAINRDLVDDYRTEVFISEMGAYVEGEIDRICQLTPPDIAIVTEVGPQHLERFGSIDNVRRAKYEIVKNLPPEGVAVLNWDNPHIREMAAARHPKTILAVSRALSLEEAEKQGVAWLARDAVETLAGLSFSVAHLPSGEGASVTCGILGEHNITNLLLCIAVAHHEGIPLRDIARRIRGLQPAESRLARQETAAGVTIINDAYSANPVGIVSAIKALSMYQTGARLLITPGMIELGDLHDEENRKLGLLAASHATDIILIGEAQTKPIAAAIRSTSFDESRLRVFETLKESIDWYQRNLKAGDAVLFLNDLPDTY